MAWVMAASLSENIDFSTMATDGRAFGHFVGTWGIAIQVYGTSIKSELSSVGTSVIR
jgi:hypothetical protein